MLLFATTILLLAGLTQQQSTQELNAYVDKILKDELPSEAKLIDPLTVRGFSFHIRDHPHYAHVKFEPSTITGLSTIHRSGDCSSYSRFPYRVYVGCNVTYGVIKVHVKSQLKYDHNSTTVTADTTFPEVHGRLYVSVGAWKGPGLTPTPSSETSQPHSPEMLPLILIAAFASACSATTVDEVNDYVDVVLSELGQQIQTPYRPKDSYNKTVAGRPEIWAYFGDIFITGYNKLERDGNCAHEEHALATGITIRCNLTTKELRVDVTGTLKHSTYPPRNVRATGVFLNPHLLMKIAVEPWKEMNVTLRLRLTVPQVKVVNLGEEFKFNSIRLGYRDEIISIIRSSTPDLEQDMKKAADSEIIPYKRK
ncbi:hypothetical protein HPB49_008665 [Dermacentor silvarum]|uniref:Uncharacterized protein n=2 Tax=Dermacentor silvarum TaxID=543639 RepID=A0ACB8CK46_DERSI|nr:hypothetical protein HPB49_008665 [Dermacentor silvarum]